MHRSIYKSGPPASRTHKVSPLAAPWTSAHMSEVDEGEDIDAEEDADSLAALPGQVQPSATSQASPSAHAFSSSSSSSSASMAPPTMPLKDASRNSKRASASSFAPIPADDCFEEALEIGIEGEGVWRVYLTPPRPPKRQRDLHTNATSQLRAAQPLPSTTIPGNPLAASVPDPALASLQLPPLSSQDDEDDESEEENQGDAAASSTKRPGTLMLFHHGAGFSGLSFALAAKEVTRLTDGEVGVLAFDCRGHGRTRHPDSKSLPLDMSLARLTADVVLLLQKLYPPPATMPTLLLVGHSMGGAVVTSLSNALQSLPTPAHVAGVAVLDVVEGTALAALDGMRGIVMAQPKGFDSAEDAIRWHLDGGIMHNSESARRSVSSLLKPNPAHNKDTATPHQRNAEQEEAMEELHDATDGGDAGLDSNLPASASTADSHPYIWRADLLSTSPHWKDWFTGLSSRFLSVRTARLLLLAGTDRLDKELMVGQMQGKYQLTVFPDVGHCLQEDAPERTAKLLVEFWRRNEVTPAQMKLFKGGAHGGLKKVGER